MFEEIIKQLKYDGEIWEAELSFPMLGDGVLLSIESGNPNEISRHQKELLEWIYINIEKVYPKVQKSVFIYYKENSETYRSALGEYADELMPIISNESEVWEYVSEPGIYISDDEESNEIHLEYECSFDLEHGLRVVLENGSIKRVDH